MRIVIDMQGAQTESRHRGIGRYTIELVKEMILNRGDDEIILALFGNLHEGAAHVRNSLRDVASSTVFVEWFAPEQKPHDYWRRDCGEAVRSAFFRSLQPDVILITSLFEGVPSLVALERPETNIVTSVIVYDLIPATDHAAYLNASPAYREDYLRKLDALPGATKILTISEHSKQQIAEYSAAANDDIVNVSAAASAQFRKDSEASAASAGVDSLIKAISDGFILYSGGFDERKNVALIVAAYGMLREDLRRHYSLVLAGKISSSQRQELQRVARRVGLNKADIVITGFLSEEDLIAAYANCSLFVFPSLHEGFGLPALEAMTCGAPVIAADSSSLPEVVGLADALFDPLSPESLSKLMDRALTDPDFDALLRDNAQTQAASFSWQKSATLSLETLRLARQQKHGSSTCEPIVLADLIEEIAALDGPRPSDPDLIETAYYIERSLGGRLI